MEEEYLPPIEAVAAAAEHEEPRVPAQEMQEDDFIPGAEYDIYLKPVPVPVTYLKASMGPTIIAPEVLTLTEAEIEAVMWDGTDTE